MFSYTYSIKASFNLETSHRQLWISKDTLKKQQQQKLLLKKQKQKNRQKHQAKADFLLLKSHPSNLVLH